jgi:uncharacterized membrane protein YfcA
MEDYFTYILLFSLRFIIVLVGMYDSFFRIMAANVSLRIIVLSLPDFSPSQLLLTSSVMDGICAVSSTTTWLLFGDIVLLQQYHFFYRKG